MRVLYITTDAYPKIGTTTNLLKKLFFDGDLLGQLDEIAVLTMKQTYLDPDQEVIDGIKVLRTYDWVLFPKEDLKLALNSCWQDALKGFFSKAHTRLFPEKPVPEEFVESVLHKALLRGLKKFHAENYDILVPVFGNYASISAVLEFTKKTNQRIVLYQVDPCSTNLAMSNDSKETRLAFEREMFSRAVAVLTTEIIQQEQKDLLPEHIWKKLIPMGLPLITEPTVRTGVSFPGENNSPVCLFSGLIYNGIRDPKHTLRLFAPLLRQGCAQLHLVGVKKEDLPEEFQNLPIVCYGRVPLDQAQEAMNGADVLVNIGNLMTNQVPSKIFDYISLGKPILNIYKNKDCPTLPYLENYPLVLNLYEDPALAYEQSSILAHFLQTVAGRRVPFSQAEELFETCTPKYCANQMLTTFQQVTGEVSQT